MARTRGSLARDNVPTPQKQLIALTPERRRALEMYIEGRHYQDIAKAVGVTGRTVYRWREDFHEMIGLFIRDDWAAFSKQMLAQINKAWSVLDRCLDGDTVPETAYRAARLVLENAGLLGWKPAENTGQGGANVNVTVTVEERRAALARGLAQFGVDISDKVEIARDGE